MTTCPQQAKRSTTCICKVTRTSIPRTLTCPPPPTPPLPPDASAKQAKQVTVPSRHPICCSSLFFSSLSMPPQIHACERTHFRSEHTYMHKLRIHPNAKIVCWLHRGIFVQWISSSSARRYTYHCVPISCAVCAYRHGHRQWQRQKTKQLVR